MQLFAKFKKIVQRGFRATLNFRKFKVGYKCLKLKLRVFSAGHIFCYGNLLCHENNINVFTSDWAVY